MLDFLKRQPKIILLLGALVVFIATIAYSVHATSQPSFCVTCHEMSPAYETWTETEHADVSCMACHADHGIVGKMKIKLNGVRQVVEHLAGRVDVESIHAEVPDYRCLDCHENDMNILAKGLRPPEQVIGQPDAVVPASTGQLEALDVVVHHEEHLELDGITCTSCHDRVVHTEAKGQLVGEEVMQRCFDCHEEKEVKIGGEDHLVSCASCHTEVTSIEPNDHKNSWMTEHSVAAAEADSNCDSCHLRAQQGEVPTAENDFCFGCHQTEIPHPEEFIAEHTAQFRANTAACATCHAEPNQVKAIWEGSLAAKEVSPETITGRSLCMDCHTLDMPHSTTWGSEHGEYALEQNQCETCHSPSNPVAADADHASEDFCVSCHGVEMPHTSNWRARHGQVALSGANCESCHSSENEWAEEGAAYTRTGYCVTCHQTTNPHPSGWLTRHDDSFKAQGEDYCQTCHVEKNECVDCHTSEDEFHPDNWKLTHKFEIEDKGLDSCQTCHTDFKQDCIDCHADTTFEGRVK